MLSLEIYPNILMHLPWGRVFAFTQMIVAGSGILAFVIAGPLADHVFEPMLASDGVLADSVGSVIGVGPGRGIAFMLILSGCLIQLTCALGYFYRGVRSLESDYPDVERSEDANCRTGVIG